ncbi:MAG: hypothetical protein OXC99_10865 [Chloroflexi bacterium]|nr:hypothetical protein [Chloroflexota bacterium]
MMFELPPLRNDPKHDAIRLADWVEVNLIMYEAQYLSVIDVTDEVARTPPDNSDDSENRGSDEAEFKSGYWEAVEQLADSAYQELLERAQCLKDYYPLSVSRGVAQLENATLACDLYQFLVLLRARQLYPNALGDDGQESGFLFEKLAVYAISAYLGSGPEHRVRFGVAGGYRGGKLPLPVTEAAEELSGRMHERPVVFSAADTRDFGGDAISWKPFLDRRPGQLAVIGQATISEGAWKDDQPAKRWTERRIVGFLARPITAVAFPETLSLTSTDELNGSDFSSIPFDRIRLLHVLQDSDLPNELVQRLKDWVQTFVQRLPR